MNHKKISECRKNSIVGVEQRLFDAAAGLPEPGTGFSQIEAKIWEAEKTAPGRTLTAGGTEQQNALDGRTSHRSGRMGRKILSGGGLQQYGRQRQL